MQQKNEAANAKLKQMVKDQQEAEKKKVESQEIQVALSKQTIQIEAKRKDVMADLALVEPAVIDAQTGTYCFLILQTAYFTVNFLIKKVLFLSLVLIFMRKKDTLS